jgi:hypothetical protein
MNKSFSSKAVAGFSPNPIFTYNLNVVGYYDPLNQPFDNTKRYTYHEMIVFCRYFYERDTIARTVINRLVNLGVTKLRNKKTSDDVNALFFDAVAEKIQPFLKLMATEYFVHGLVVPGITYKTIMMNKLNPALGRKRVEVPDEMWVRNVANIKLRKRPTGMQRGIYLQIPEEEATFIQHKGKRLDGTDDTEAYKELLRQSPEYVRAVQNGQRIFPLTDSRAIYGDLTSYTDYPVPYLQNALSAMQHKEYLKIMDRTIVSRSIELLRQVKIGSDEYPATDDDIEATQKAIAQASASGDRVFNLFTNHTVDIQWVLPPLDALLNESKYAEPNADIFLAMGFPRILTVGESLRSNSSDSRIATLGPMSTLTEVRERILSWIEWFYEDLAERNNMATWPKPYFSPIQFQDMTALTQFAIQAQQIGAISKDTISQLYGTTYEEEQQKISFEVQADDTNQQEPGTPEEPGNVPGTRVQPPEEQ